MPKPLRLIFDSLTPLALNYSPDEFVAVVNRKNRLINQPEVTIFDTILHKTLLEGQMYSLLNAYDIVLDLYIPNWGEMGLSSETGYRALRVNKARGVGADLRPYPYTISPAQGLQLENHFYRRQIGI
jgi:circadian clock protein KaiC